jgi:hypothetical protein
MTAYSHTQLTPRAARRATHVHTHFGTYAVGAGATSALTAAALVAFLSLATFVAFNGFPFAGSSSDVGAVYLDATGNAATAATAAGRAVGTAATAVARDAVSGSTAGGRGDEQGGSGGSSAADPAGGPSGGGASSGTGAGGSGGLIDAPPPQVAPSASGPVGSILGQVGSATGTNLSAANGAARVVDGAAGDIGGAAGRPRLGDQAGGAVNRVTQTVLPSAH